MSAVDAEAPSALATVRELIALDGIDVTARGLPVNETFAVYASSDEDETAIVEVTSNDAGVVGEALAFVQFFENGYEHVSMEPVK